MEHPWVYAFKLLLRELGLSQAAAAEKIGVSQATVCNWCNGRLPRLPGLRLVERWSKGRVPAVLALAAA